MLGGGGLVVLEEIGGDWGMVDVPVPGPFSEPVFEDLKDSWSDVMFCVEPWDGYVGVKRGFPFEATV